MKIQPIPPILFFSLFFGGALFAAPPRLDQSPPGPLEWGFRPREGEKTAVTPPAFSWRPAKGIASWEVQVGADPGFRKIAYQARGIPWNVHCPPKALPPGRWFWRYRGRTRKGRPTPWSKVRSFSVPKRAVTFPLPPREELLERIPKAHPRLFLRPSDLPRLRRLVKGPLQGPFRKIERACARLLKRPPPTAEPPKYPPGTVRGSDPWRKIWWGNRTYTIRALGGAAELAFASLLDGRKDFAALARKILLDCARWDPRGSTGYRYNDEAGMPFAYHFSRAYTFLHDKLTKAERALCRKVMARRGKEMFRHLCPRHFWRPYSSHDNRAWHFLGEVGIAFYREIPQAADWVWFAANTFFCVYPVWSDSDGGWHEGAAYWNSYLSRFTWWADVMRAALGIDAYKKPFFSRAGDFALYILPPGKRGGGFGDLCAAFTSKNALPLMSVFAAQAGNPYWQWYVESQGGPVFGTGYVGLLRRGLPRVKPRPPSDLPASKLFAGVGQAALNTTLLDAEEDTQVLFKSSPFGSWSHGYEAQNALLLFAFGERLLIRSGKRDSYGSAHHRLWMWSTRSVNCVTVNGRGQVPHSAAAGGRIFFFRTTPRLDAAAGEAGAAYGTRDGRRVLDRFTRAVFFVKPGLVLVYDLLSAPRPSTYTWWWHARDKFHLTPKGEALFGRGKVLCRARFAAPEGLSFFQTNQYDPNPRPRIKLREWHLRADFQKPRRKIEAVTLFQPYKKGSAPPGRGRFLSLAGGYALRIPTKEGEALFLLPAQGSKGVRAFGLSTGRETALVRLLNRKGKPIQTMKVNLHAEGK